jgi:hypothetical protein
VSSGRYRKLQPLSTADAAYIAGLIDGEGTVTLTRQHRNDYRQLSVSISSTEIAMLKYVKLVTGVGIITNKKTSKSHHAPSFTFAVYNRQALALLEQTVKFLQSYKRKRSVMVIENYIALTPRNGKYTVEMLDRKKAFEQAVLAITARG